MAYTLPVNLANEVNAEAADVMSDLNYLLGLFNGSNPWPFTAGTHGDLSATTTTMHTAQAVAVVDSALKYTGTNVETVLAEIATTLGIGDSGGLARISLADFAYHASTPNSCELTVAANSATSGLILLFGVNIGNPTGNGFLPIEMNVDGAGYTALDSDAGSGVQTNPLYSVGAGQAGGSFMRAAIFLPTGTTPTWNPAVVNKFRYGTPFQSGGSTSTSAMWMLSLRLR